MSQKCLFNLEISYTYPMVNSLRAKYGPSTGTSRYVLPIVVLLLLSAFAKDIAIPAIALPTSPRAGQQHILPADVLAPTSNTRTAALSHIKSGMASWYGTVLQGHLTASGRRFNMYEMTAAHRDLPFGSKVKVTNLRNQRSVIVTITDRGVLFPERVIDLSYGAAKQLQMIKSGVDPVTLEVMSTNPIPLPHR
jgi:rare lipoprotein A